MSALALPLVTALTRAWVRLYTTGLPPKRRDERRAEIDCDLWEQERDARINGGGAHVIGWAIAIRLLLGIPADLSWRAEYGLLSKQTGIGGQTNPGGRVMNAPAVQRGMTVVAVLAALSFLFFGGFRALDIFMFSNGWSYTVSNAPEFFAFVGPILAIAGLFLTERSPLLGTALVAVGAVMMVLSFFWFFPFWPVALLPLVIGVYRGRRFSRLERPRGLG